MLYEGNETGAIELWKRTLVSDPELKEIPVAIKNVKKSNQLKEEGSNLYKQKKIQEAISKWEEAVQIDPYYRKFNSLVFSNLMTGYNKLKNNEKALRAINDAIAADPNFAKAYFKRAELYCSIEDYSQAVRDYQQAQNLDPSMNLKNTIKATSDKEARKAASKDYYKIMGVDSKATQKEIKKAYHKLCMKYHPDRQDNEESKQLAYKKMLDINEAYGTLKNEESRKKYDLLGIDGSNGGGFSSGGGMPNFSHGTGSKTFTTFNMGGDDHSSMFNNFNMFFGDGTNNNFSFGKSAGTGGAKSRMSDPFAGHGFGEDPFAAFKSGNIGGSHFDFGPDDFFSKHKDDLFSKTRFGGKGR